MADQIEFAPFSTEDLDSKHALQEERYYQVVDAVEELLLEKIEQIVDAGELEEQYDRDGYSRGIYVDNYLLTIHYNRRLWQSHLSVETPFWFEMWEEDEEDTESDFNSVLEDIFERYPQLWKGTIDGSIVLALFAPTNVGIEEVAVTLEKQILNYFAVAIKDIKEYNDLLDEAGNDATGEDEEDEEDEDDEDEEGPGYDYCEEPPREELPRLIDVGDEIEFDDWHDDALISKYRGKQADSDMYYDPDNPTENDYLEYEPKERDYDFGFDY